MNIIFFGSSEFSLAALRACLDTGQKVLLAVTTPDQKKGRGLQFSPTPVKEFCLSQSISVIAPENLKSEELIHQIRSLKPEAFVVSSYGKLIPTSWLEIPSKVALNVHPSLLPKYRGAAPIQWAILNGDTHTGVCIAEVTKDLDAGDIFIQTVVPLDESINAEELSRMLAEVSYHLLIEALRAAENNSLKRREQDPGGSVYARKLAKEDGLISWNKSAVEIANQIRGLLPWPVAHTTFRGEILQAAKARFGPGPSNSTSKPGEILSIQKEGGIEVQTGSGVLVLERVRPAGKKEMSGFDFANGRRLQSGMVLGS